MTGVGLGKGHLKPVASQEGSEGDRRIRVGSERLPGGIRSVCLRADRHELAEPPRQADASSTIRRVSKGLPGSLC